jgi:hypothetical protein
MLKTLDAASYSNQRVKKLAAEAITVDRDTTRELSNPYYEQSLPVLQ